MTRTLIHLLSKKYLLQYYLLLTLKILHAHAERLAKKVGLRAFKYQLLSLNKGQ